MSVISTDEWLLESYDDPIKLCENIQRYFDGASASDIYLHLTIHGMYNRPLKNGIDQIKRLQEKGIWEIIREQEIKLRKLWNGPNIPIFIFPSELSNRELRQNFNGKSGLSFADKLFLFVSEGNSTNEMKALFTHEYNHVCRLTSYKKKEKDYVLLDTIILEGLAENAVIEQLGTKYTANWVSYYNDTELENIWYRHIFPMSHLPKYLQKHRDILYGMNLYPKMVGYCVGFYLVKRFMRKHKFTSKELLPIESKEIAQIKESESEDE